MMLGPISPKTIQSHQFLNEETRIKIAVIDTGINIKPEMRRFLCNGEHYDFTGTGIEDNNGHGTNIAGIIANRINPETHCILVMKWLDNGLTFGWNSELNALRKASEEHVKFVNYSASGESKNAEEYIEIKRLIKEKIYFITAAGNHGQNLSKKCNAYPACYGFVSPYFRVVGNGPNEKERHYTSNYGLIVTDWRNGLNQEGFGVILSGTSQATAKVTSELAQRNIK